MTAGAFRVQVNRPGPEADRILRTLREHATLHEVAPGCYEAQIDSDSLSGTDMSSLTYVLEREHAGWAQYVEMRPTDHPWPESS